MRNDHAVSSRRIDDLSCQHYKVDGSNIAISRSAGHYHNQRTTTNKNEDNGDDNGGNMEI